jgi:hypothetical protein
MKAIKRLFKFAVSLATVSIFIDLNLVCQAQENVPVPANREMHYTPTESSMKESKWITQRREIGKLIASSQYDVAWKAASLMFETSHAGENYEMDFSLLTWIALYAPVDDNIFKERYTFIQKYLAKMVERQKKLQAQNNDLKLENKKDNSWKVFFALQEMKMVQSCYAMASLALAKDDIKQVREFLKMGSSFAQTGEFIYLPDPKMALPTLPFGVRDDYGTQKKEILWALIQDLLVFREHDEAMRVIECQWEYLLGTLSLPSGATEQRRSVIHALSLAKLADMLRARGDLPVAAKYYNGALIALNDLKAIDKLATMPEILEAHKEVKHQMKYRETYGIWTGVQEKKHGSLPQDLEPLKKDLEVILNAYVAALIKGDIKTASFYVDDNEKQETEIELKRLAVEVQREKIATIIYSNLNVFPGLGIPNKETSVGVSCKIKTLLLNGEEKSGETVYAFVRVKDGWKIKFILSKKQGDKK